jgi:2-methylcitrate dehydratase
MSAQNITERIARFSSFSAYDQLKPATIEQLKKHLLDAVGSMLYSMKAPTVKKLFSAN